MPNQDIPIKQQILDTLNKRFQWRHSPEGRGYLYDTEGTQTVDEVIMAGFLSRSIDIVLTELERNFGDEKEFNPEDTVYSDPLIVDGYNMARSKFINIIAELKK